MKTIEEKNRLIAEFMGIVSFSDTDDGQLWVNITYSSGLTKGRDYAEWATTWGEVDHFDGSKYGYHVPAEFHTSWDWLMPVVENIDHLEYESERLDKIDNAIKTRQINAVHNAVVEFIEWYNEQNSQS